MTKLPRLTAREIIAVLEKAGFSLARQSGSHMIYKNAAGKRVTVPFHAAKTLHPKILKSILRDADLTPEGLQKLL
ncbi:MAG: type II toxin-antitoxin system HicA family toxin [Acidobacteriia bacterium]|nr:type II toxin-antitoxin system HicA family toxin [Terriglobia bacterium]